MHQYLKLSEILTSTLKQAQADGANLESLIDALDSRAYGIVLVLLTIPNLIPGISSISAGIIFYYSIQMCFGRKKPHLPDKLAAFKIDSNFRHILQTIIDHTSKLERFTKPRWVLINSTTALKMVGVVLMFFSVIIFFPIPFSNFIPSIAILLIALGLLQKDGALVVFSTVLGISYCIGYIWIISKFLSSFI